MTEKKERMVTILCSGVALGVYIPALLLNRRLRERGMACDVSVLESVYKKESMQQLKEMRKAYHQNFSVALMAHRMVKDLSHYWHRRRVNALLERWRRENRLDFAVWSGFWMPIIERHREQMAPRRLNVHLCRIDADVSASFKIYPMNEQDTEIWLWHGGQKRLVHEIPVSGKPVVPFNERRDRCVIHGGGWGIGTYRERAGELQAAGLAMDVVVYDRAEAGGDRGKNRYFMVDPDWSGEQVNQHNENEFPPFGEIDERGEGEFKNRPEYHELYDIIREARAIISKPGGGTLIDSLASATPVVMLEPYGYAEKSNAETWEYLGFGIPYQKWKEMNFDWGVLEKLQGNLVNREKTTIDYPGMVAGQIRYNGS